MPPVFVMVPTCDGTVGFEPSKARPVGPFTFDVMSCRDVGDVPSSSNDVRFPAIATSFDTNRTFAADTPAVGRLNSRAVQGPQPNGPGPYRLP